MGKTSSRDEAASPAPGGGAPILAGGLAALLASACCLGPLLLISIGVSGAWIGSLTALEPYRPLFAGVSILALWVAARRIWRPAVACVPGQVCAVPRVKRIQKLLFGAVAVLVVVALAFPYAAPWFY